MGTSPTNPATARQRHDRPALGIILGVGLAAGLFAFFATREYVRQRDSQHAEIVAREVIESLRADLRSPLEALHLMKSVLELPGHVLTHAQFQTLARAAQEHRSYLVALQWCPWVRPQDRAAFERYMQRDHRGYQIREPGHGAELVVAAHRPLHLPIAYSEPFVPKVHGLDLASDEMKLAPARQAASSGQVVVGHRYRLLQDDRNALTLIAHAPVRHAHWIADLTQTQGEHQEGVLLALFRIDHLIQHSLDRLPRKNVEIELRDPDAPEELKLLYLSSNAQLDHAVVLPLEYGNRRFELRVATRTAPLDWWSWGSGIGVFVVCAATLFWLRARRKARALERSLRRLGVYQLEGRIATGGMGTIFKAQHALLKRPTAIKIARDAEQGPYFAKEVVLTSRLTHPNTVSIYDYGEGQDGSFYCAMEYIEGYDLQRLIELYGPIPDGRCVRFLLQAASSLKEAHDHGLVHRDVKPSNIMITERGGMRDFIKVLDFGLVKQQPELVRKETFPSLGQFAFAGTPGYVAPEVIAGSPASAASDIFALGAVAYFLLSGHAPFAGASAVEALTKALRHTVPPLPQTVHEDLDRLIRACLDRNPAHRPTNMGALLQELRRVHPSCRPWTNDDADQWWALHPPERHLQDSATSLTFLLRHGSTATRSTDSASPLQRASSSQG